jgi:hypothetical protein
MHTTSQSEFVHYKGLGLSPLDAGSSKMRLLFRVSQSTASLPHLRSIRGQIVDIATATHDEGLSNSDSVSGVSLYAGPYIPHFGHFISECIHRLYARNEDARLRNAKVVFHARANAKIEPWLFPVFDICGVKPEEVIFIDKPRMFEELVVPPQARLLNGPTLKPGYAETFPAGSNSASGAGESYYVSRAKHYYSGSYAGERVVESFLERHGFKVLYPEARELKDVVAMLSTAANIIFAEGSAIHNLELCGKMQARIMVVARRAGAKERFGHLLEEYGSAHRIFEGAHVLGPLEWNANTNNPNWPRSISLVDLRALIADISDFFQLEAKLPTQQDWDQAILADLGRFILDSRTTRRTSNEQLGLALSMLREKFRTSEFGKDVVGAFDTEGQTAQKKQAARRERAVQPGQEQAGVQVNAVLPTRHVLKGIAYIDFLSRFHANRQPQSYLEIGVNKGKSLASVACATVGIDPEFILSSEMVGKKPFLFLAQMTSDDFFSRFDPFSFFPKGVDVAFLDGMHLFEYLLRDFINAEKFAHKDSVCFLHDCLPINYEMAERVRNRGARIDQEFGSHWTGDVWKLYPILTEFRPDLEITILDCPPTGLVMIRNMDSKSTILRDNYDAIVARYLDVVLDDEGLLRLRQSMTIASAEAILGASE